MRGGCPPQVVTYLASCGLQSCPMLLSKGYPDIGWNPCGGERYLDFLRFAVFVNGERGGGAASLRVCPPPCPLPGRSLCPRPGTLGVPASPRPALCPPGSPCVPILAPWGSLHPLDPLCAPLGVPVSPSWHP